MPSEESRILLLWLASSPFMAALPSQSYLEMQHSLFSMLPCAWLSSCSHCWALLPPHQQGGRTPHLSCNPAELSCDSCITCTTWRPCAWTAATESCCMVGRTPRENCSKQPLSSWEPPIHGKFMKGTAEILLGRGKITWGGWWGSQCPVCVPTGGKGK